MKQVQAALTRLGDPFTDDLPGGAIHADYFPDNVLFEDGAVSAVIDFYFGCTGAFAYDLYKNRGILDAAALGNVAIGFVCAFITAIFVVRWLLDYVSARGYGLFAWWRIVVGAVVLVALAAGS